MQTFHEWWGKKKQEQNPADQLIVKLAEMGIQASAGVLSDYPDSIVIFCGDSQIPCSKTATQLCWMPNGEIHTNPRGSIPLAKISWQQPEKLKQYICVFCSQAPQYDPQYDKANPKWLYRKNKA